MGGFNRASDEELRRQARARAYSYAYSGNGASSGGGAGYAGYANGRGGHAYDQARWGEGPDGMGNPNPNGNYTTNTRFIGSLFIIVSAAPETWYFAKITSLHVECSIQYDPVQPSDERLFVDPRTNGCQTRGVRPYTILQSNSTLIYSLFPSYQRIASTSRSETGSRPVRP